MTEAEFMSQPIEALPLSRKKRRRCRRYPRPEYTEAQWKAILELQRGRCAICGEEKELYQDHSYRTGKMRGGLCRQCNCALGMLKDSPSRLRKALTYLQNPPANALGFGDTERETIKA
jgi:Recombination endonuclease VII